MGIMFLNNEIRQKFHPSTAVFFLLSNFSLKMERFGKKTVLAVKG